MFKTRVNHTTINRTLFLKGMAKSDSFFIRAEISSPDGTFQQTAIDLGSYVDVLDKSVLRIHRVEVQHPRIGASSTPSAHASLSEYQLTTQSQTALVSLTDKSVISTGKLICAFAPASGTPALGYATAISDAFDVTPQDWTNGYLVGVEQIYFGSQQTNDADFVGAIEIMMECSVETLTASAAMALSLSQQ
jgi:hypothetical protein